MLEIFSNNHRENKTIKPLLLPRRSCPQRRVFSGLCTHWLSIKNSIRKTMPVNEFYSSSSSYVLKSPPAPTAFKTQSNSCVATPGQACSLVVSPTSPGIQPHRKFRCSQTHRGLSDPRAFLGLSTWHVLPLLINLFSFVKLRLNGKCSEKLSLPPPAPLYLSALVSGLLRVRTLLSS